MITAHAHHGTDFSIEVCTSRSTARTGFLAATGVRAMV
jgi:hypothetical protein